MKKTKEETKTVGNEEGRVTKKFCCILASKSTLSVNAVPVASKQLIWNRILGSVHWITDPDPDANPAPFKSVAFKIPTKHEVFLGSIFAYFLL